MKTAVHVQLKPLHRQFSYLIQIFVYYVKTRTPPVYCFPIATILSFLLISKTHVLEDPLVVFGIGIASDFLGLATYVYNDLTDIDVDQINRNEQSVVTQNQSRRGLIILVIFLFGLASHNILCYQFFCFPYFNRIYCLGYFLFSSQVQPEEQVPFENHRYCYRSRTFIFARWSSSQLAMDQTMILRLIPQFYPYPRSTWHFRFLYSILFSHLWVILQILREIELPVGRHFH